MQKKSYILFFILHFCIGAVYSSAVHYNNQANPQKKGMHRIMQDLAADTETFLNKELKIDFGVQNAREGNSISKIDVYCETCSDDGLQLLVEYKHGPNSITSKKIKEQFIERDLFNATNLNQIQWRMKDTEFTKELLNDYLNAHRDAIEQLGVDKINLLFNTSFDEFTSNSQLSQTVIDYFNNTNNYNAIFK